MKKTDMERLKGARIAGQLKQAGAPARYGKDSAAESRRVAAPARAGARLGADSRSSWTPGWSSACANTRSVAAPRSTPPSRSCCNRRSTAWRKPRSAPPAPFEVAVRVLNVAPQLLALLRGEPPGARALFAPLAVDVAPRRIDLLAQPLAFLRRERALPPAPLRRARSALAAASAAARTSWRIARRVSVMTVTMVRNSAAAGMPPARNFVTMCFCAAGR